MTREEHAHVNYLLNWCAKNHFAVAMANFYLQDGPLLLERMLAQGVDWNELGVMNAKVIELVKAKEMPKAALAYGDMILLCMERYWPDCRNPLYAHAKKLAEEGRARVAEGKPVEGDLVPDYYLAQGIKTIPRL